MSQITRLSDVPVVSGDNNSASTGHFPFLDEVNVIETVLVISGLKLDSQTVITNASSIHDGMRWENVLSVFKPVIRMDGVLDWVTDTHRSTSGSVLCSSPSNIGDLVVLHNIIVAII